MQDVVVALVRRRAAMAGEIEATYARLKTLVNDMETIDAAIVQFDPTYVVEAIRPKAFRPPEDWSNHGQMARMCLSILRQATEPMSSRDVAVEMLVTRALDRDDQRLIRLMVKRVGVSLRHQRDNGVVRSAQGPGMTLLWEVVR